MSKENGGPASDRELLDSKVLAYLQTVGGSSAWSMRHAVGEMDRKIISKSLQRLKRKGLVRTDYLCASYWRPVISAAAAIWSSK